MLEGFRKTFFSIINQILKCGVSFTLLYALFFNATKLILLSNYYFALKGFLACQIFNEYHSEKRSYVNNIHTLANY